MLGEKEEIGATLSTDPLCLVDFSSRREDNWDHFLIGPNFLMV